MVINWKINYANKTAKCDDLHVKIFEEKSYVKSEKKGNLLLGFTKHDTGKSKSFVVEITGISQELHSEGNNDIQAWGKKLAKYGSSLGDVFDEKRFKDVR